MRSGYSTAVRMTTPAGETPMPPVLVSKSAPGPSATLVYALPTAAVNGVALPPGAFTELLVYATKETFAGRLEAVVGMEPHAKVTAAVGGPNITVEIPGLELGVEYEFIACVN